VRARAHDAGALAGASLIDLREERFGGTRALEDARRLLHAALAACLEGRPLATRAVARSMVRKAAQS
jgi:DNA repair protein RecO (recombination protein O)